MKASELRIGNLVYSGKKEYVSTLYSFLGLYEVENKPKKFKPIPLNSDWMNRFGFELLPWGWVLSKAKEKTPLIRYNIHHEKFWCELGNGVRIELPYVHTLQNFIALTGTELTIK